MHSIRTLSALSAFAALTLPVVLVRAQTPANPLPEPDARKVALQAAGCQLPDECSARGRFDTDRWVFVVSYSRGNDERGYPIISGAGAMRVTLAASGEVLDRFGVAQP